MLALNLHIDKKQQMEVFDNDDTGHKNRMPSLPEFQNDILRMKMLFSNSSSVEWTEDIGTFIFQSENTISKFLWHSMNKALDTPYSLEIFKASNSTLSPQATSFHLQTTKKNVPCCLAGQPPF